MMPGLLPAGQVGPLEDSDSEDEEIYRRWRASHQEDGDGDGDGYGDLPGLVSTDNESDDESDDDEPPGLLPTDDESEGDDSEGEETLASMYCPTCEHICECTVDIASSWDELVVGETLTPSSALKRGKRKLENILDQSFSHETWKYGRIVQPNQPYSDDDNDPNVPFDWKSLSHSERKKKLCEDLHLNNNPILDAEPAQRDRLQDLVANYSDIWTDGLIMEV